MGLIKLDDAQPGMILGAEVCDHTGRRLMTAGQELSDRALRIFRMWGIVEIDVTGAGVETPDTVPLPDLDSVVAERARVRAEELFRHTDRQHPMIAELLRLTTRRLAERMAGTGRMA